MCAGPLSLWYPFPSTARSLDICFSLFLVPSLSPDISFPLFLFTSLSLDISFPWHLFPWTSLSLSISSLDISFSASIGENLTKQQHCKTKAVRDRIAKHMSTSPQTHVKSHAKVLPTKKRRHLGTANLRNSTSPNQCPVGHSAMENPRFLYGSDSYPGPIRSWHGY